MWSSDVTTLWVGVGVVIRRDYMVGWGGYGHQTTAWWVGVGVVIRCDYMMGRVGVVIRRGGIRYRYVWLRVWCQVRVT